ncbi:hypothetical protein P6U16_26015 (plasmid) [Rhizobium sp. 32-5/1]|uniref:hypothetical protein n=1 Tax=Rhizobium sp. 32-5/1 TaxID=3019602 RepID=UPI00240E856C|nr:hypothetical protein [Rhizobium sp. 32-5/1]WEZ85520.1 hypothetical protein P6U16_26015 [Rhizobium sp. 32-5/1]
MTIYMPSNRTLEGSKDAIESLLAFSQATGCRMVISDNSQDPRKYAAFSGRSDNLAYLTRDDTNAQENAISALSKVETSFVMPMGDDDTIRLVDKLSPIDLSRLAPDVVMVRPQTEIWVEKSGVLRTENFSIELDDPAERIAQYGRTSLGNNSIFYSICRSEYYLGLHRHFSAWHPTKGGYCDWSMTTALIASGKVVHDPAIVYRYDLGRWSSNDTLEIAKASLFVQAGLPPEAHDFYPLLRFIDTYVMLMSRHLPLDQTQRDKTLAINSTMGLAAFVNAVKGKPERYNDTVHHLVDLILEEAELNTVFIIALMLAECLQLGLKDRYLAYYQAVTSEQTRAV